MPASPSEPDGLVEGLYRQHHSWLTGFLRRKLDNSQDALDLAQDTFIRILQSRDAASIREPRRYLATIANGLVSDRYRRRLVEHAFLDTLAAREEPLELSAEARHQLLETLVALDRLLDSLDRRTREIFLLSRLEGMTHQQIAQRQGVSVTTVKKHLSKALLHCLDLEG